MPRLEDLDPATRKAVQQAIGRRSSGGQLPERQRARPSSAGSGGRADLTCECGDTFATAAAMDRHPAGPGHTRVSARLDQQAGHGHAVASDATPQPEGATDGTVHPVL